MIQVCGKVVADLTVQIGSNGEPIVKLQWVPGTGEKQATCMLPLDPSRAADVRTALCQMADQIVLEHLENVHRVQGKLETWLREQDNG